MFITISGSVDSSHRERRLTGDAELFASFKLSSPSRIDEQSVDNGSEGAEQSGEVEGGVSENVIQDLKEAFGTCVAASFTMFL